MTLKEKRDFIDTFCMDYDGDELDSCNGCPFNEPDAWCRVGNVNDLDDKAADAIIRKIKNHTGDNPYWNNITKLAEKQRSKGISTYGQGIEDNPADPLTRIQYIEEELIDALMYLEWLKESLHGKEQSE